MKRVLAALLAGTLFISGVNPAFAVVKEGSSCTKLNHKQTIGTKSYQCKKSNGKLKWKLITPTPTKSAISIPPTSPEIEKVQALLTKALANSKSSNSKIEIVVGPGTENQVIAEIVKSNLEIALRIGENLGLELSKSYTAYVGDENWLEPFMPSGTWCADKATGVPGGASAGFCGMDSGVIFVSRTGFLFDGNKPVARDFTKGADRSLVAISFIHEVFHLVQTEAARKFAGTKGNFNPFWLNEGGANFAVALALSESEKISYNQARTWIKSYGNCMPAAEQFKLLDFISNTGNQGVCGPYFSGFLWSEFLVAKTGDLGALVGLAKVDKSVLDGLQWDPNNSRQYEEDKLAAILKSLYGFEFKTFVAEANQYSVKAAKELLAWNLSNN